MSIKIYMLSPRRTGWNLWIRAHLSRSPNLFFYFISISVLNILLEIRRDWRRDSLRDQHQIGGEKTQYWGGKNIYVDKWLAVCLLFLNSEKSWLEEGVLRQGRRYLSGYSLESHSPGLQYSILRVRWLKVARYVGDGKCMMGSSNSGGDEEGTKAALRP